MDKWVSVSQQAYERFPGEKRMRDELGRPVFEVDPLSEPKLHPSAREWADLISDKLNAIRAEGDSVGSAMLDFRHLIAGMLTAMDENLPSAKREPFLREQMPQSFAIAAQERLDWNVRLHPMKSIAQLREERDKMDETQEQEPAHGM